MSTTTINAPATKAEARYVDQFEKYVDGKSRFPSPNGIPTARTHPNPSDPLGPEGFGVYGLRPHHGLVVPRHGPIQGL